MVPTVSHDPIDCISLFSLLLLVLGCLSLTNFIVHSCRLPSSHRVEGADVVMVEGILALHDEAVRCAFDVKIFVDADADVRLARRLRRDMAERGRTVDNVLTQYDRTVRPSFEAFTLPTRSLADLVIPFNAMNAVAIEIVVGIVARATQCEPTSLNAAL